MFPRKTMLAATAAAAFAVTPAAFATPPQDLRGEAAARVQSAPLTVDGGGDAVPIVLLAAAGTLAMAGGAGMLALRPRTRAAY